MSNVSGVIKSIQDIMRKDVGVDGDAQRISQLVWMFFLKIFDDREAELELVEDDYQSPLPEHLRWRAWANRSYWLAHARYWPPWRAISPRK